MPLEGFDAVFTTFDLGGLGGSRPTGGEGIVRVTMLVVVVVCANAGVRAATPKIVRIKRRIDRLRRTGRV